MRFLTKRNTLLFSTLSVIVFVVMWNTGTDFWCDKNGTYSYSCGDTFGAIFVTLTPLMLLLAPSLLTTFFNIRIFESWKRFAIWAMSTLFAITLLIIFSGEGNAYFSFGFGPFLLGILYGWYIVHSIAVIGFSWWAQKKGSRAPIIVRILAEIALFALTVALLIWIGHLL